MPDQLLNLVFFCLKQCGDEDSGNDYDYYSSLGVKNGESTKTDCPSNTVCCVPKPKEEVVKCTSLENRQCLRSDVSQFNDNFWMNNWIDSFCLQQCGDEDSGNDFDYYSLEVKNGASIKFDCLNGEVCCEPKITKSSDEKNECEGITGHTCMTEEVSTK